MKITTAATAPSGIVAAYKNAPSPQKAAQVSPAYAIDLSQRARRWQDTQHIRHIQETTTVASNLKEIPYDEGLSSVQKGIAAAQQKIRDNLGDKNVGPIAESRPLETIPLTYEKGLDVALMEIEGERKIAPHIGTSYTPLDDDVQKHFDTYTTIRKTLSHGTANDFRAFNLKLAGIAKAGLDQTEQDRAAYHISMGDYAAGDLKQASDFARTLQEKAGVYVAMDFQSYVETDATGIDFSYNGTLAKIGAKELSFMSAHQESMDVWVRAAQGSYQSAAEIASALSAAGLSSTASAYQAMLSTASSGGSQQFSHSAGALWTAFVGYDDPKTADVAYQHIQSKLRGSDTSSLTYDASELNSALSEGYTEKRFLEGITGSREYSASVIDKYGRAHLLNGKSTPSNKKESEAASSPEESMSYADAAIKRLQEKIADIREQNIAPAEKQKQINAIKQQILTYQNMKLQDQKRDTVQSH